MHGKIKGFLRSNGIKYTLNNEKIVVNSDPSFPNLFFTVENNYVKITPIPLSISTISFPASNLYQLLAKLLRYNIITVHQLKKYKY